MKLPKSRALRTKATPDYDDRAGTAHDPPPVRCNIARLMEREGLWNPTDFKNAAAAKGFHMNAPRIRQFMAGDADHVTMDELGIFAEVLGCEVGDLFERVESSIWNVARSAGTVCIHLASRRTAEHERQPTPEQLAVLVDREFVGIWDVWAAAVVLAHVYSVAPDAAVELYVHPYGVADGYCRPGWTPAEMVRDGAVHVIIGSPAASTFTEEVVSGLYDVDPYEPDTTGVYRYLMAWTSRREVRSSFGIELPEDACGIVDPGRRELIAERSFVGPGEKGTDAAVTLTWRFAREDVKGARKGIGDGAVIACLGVSGPGTLAAAQAVTSQRLRGELYPEQTGRPLMRALSATYRRAAGESGRDTRKLEGWALVPAPSSGRDERAA